MKFLLFFISLVYSIIFYTFYNLSKWKDVFWNRINNFVELQSISWNLLIESFIFLLIGIIFLYFFSSLKSKWQKKIENYKIEILYFLFYSISIFYIYFFNNWLDDFSILIIILFILSDLIFNHLSNIKYLYKNKVFLKYLWLILNYIVSTLSIYYIYDNWIYFIPFFILIFSILFNFLVHKRFTNYISLFISILIILFLFYSLFFSLFELYILYI